MKKEELIERLEDIEWEDFEVKEAKSEIPKSGWETMFSGWKSYYQKGPIVSGDVDFYKIEFLFGLVKSSGKNSGKILELLKENNLLSIPELAREIGLTTRAVEKQIAKLKRERKLNRIGAAKGGHWEVNER